MSGFNLSINSGPQDSLLYDPTRSYFTNVGYVRTSNFAMELRDVDPQNTAMLGSTVQFVIPKAADLLGPVDLMLEFNQSNSSTGANSYAAWVEAVGLAMIERIQFSIGSHDIETLTGEHLAIMNELMKSDEQRLGYKQILKTGDSAVKYDINEVQSGSAGAKDVGASASGNVVQGDVKNGRLICSTDQAGTATHYPGKKLIVPLGLFFTKHPSQYFPLCAIAGANDVRISIKLRSLNDLLVLSATDYPVDDTNKQIINAALDASTAAGVSAPTFTSSSAIKSGTCKLRCHYVHVTGPEATSIMNKEHVRLLRQWSSVPKTVTLPGSAPSYVGAAAGVAGGTRAFGLKTGSDALGAEFTVDMDLSFLHPISELIITIRKTTDMGSSTTAIVPTGTANKGATEKNYFAYHGGGADPNIESIHNKTRSATSGDSGVEAGFAESFLRVDSFKLTLNGQDRHPSLAADGIDRDYLMERLMPMLHSNTSTAFTEAADTYGGVASGAAESVAASADLKQLAQKLDRKEIYVYPFAINPEGANPSGAVNFSKVSHAKLQIKGRSFSTTGVDQEYVVDVYGINYNWLQIKDGRGLISFA